MAVYNILVADAPAAGQAGLRAIIEAEPLFALTGEAASGEEAVQAALQLRPDLLVMGVELPGMGGLEATRLLKPLLPALKVVLVADSDDAALLLEAIRRGAQGYASRKLPAAAWLDYLRAIAMDDAPMPAGLAAQIVQQLGLSTAASKKAARSAPKAARAEERGGEAAKGLRQPRQPRMKLLTNRERQILEQVAQGQLNRAIAGLLGISENTVKNHLKNMMHKLQLDNRVQLARYAMESGLLEHGDERG